MGWYANDNGAAFGAIFNRIFHPRRGVRLCREDARGGGQAENKRTATAMACPF